MLSSAQTGFMDDLGSYECYFSAEEKTVQHGRKLNENETISFQPKYFPLIYFHLRFKFLYFTGLNIRRVTGFILCSRGQDLSDEGSPQFNSGFLVCKFCFTHVFFARGFVEGRVIVVVKHKVNFRIKSVIFCKLLPLPYYKSKIRYT